MHEFSIRVTGSFDGDGAELRERVERVVAELAVAGKVDHASINGHVIHVQVDKVEVAVEDPDRWLLEVDRKAKELATPSGETTS